MRYNPFSKVEVWSLLILLFFPFIHFFIKYLKITQDQAGIAVELFNTVWYAAMLAWIVWKFKRNNLKFHRLFGKIPSGIQWLSLAGLLISSIVFSLSLVYLGFFVLAFFNPSLVESLINGVDVSGDGTLFLSITIFLSSVIFMPFVEELVHRGVFLHKLGKNIFVGIICSSAIFGILHRDAALGAFFFGIVASILYISTRSLAVPMVFHMANNLLPSIGEILARGSDEPTTITALQSFGWIIILVFIVSGVITWYFLRKFWPKKWVLPYIANK